MLNQLNILLTNIYCQFSLIDLSIINELLSANLSTKSCCRIDGAWCTHVHVYFSRLETDYHSYDNENLPPMKKRSGLYKLITHVK